MKMRWDAEALDALDVARAAVVRWVSGICHCGACAMPLPCRSAIFSSRVICFSANSARSSGESLVFIQGPSV